MQIRADGRTPCMTKAFKSTDINGIPIVKEYKYLGVIIDDQLKLDIEKSRK